MQETLVMKPVNTKLKLLLNFLKSLKTVSFRKLIQNIPSY